MAQDNLYDELTDEIATAGVLGNNKVANFAYTDTAYADITQAAGTDEYDPDLENNIPTASSEVLNTNPTVLAKGMRSQASSLTRQLVNHFFGRTSYNLNKTVDTFKAALTSIKNALGRSNGLATLDASGRIPYSQLPESALEYKGGWNASTNQPHLADGTGTTGDMYLVTTAGYANLGHGSEYFYADDRVVYNGTVWQRIPAGDVKTVCSVAPDGNGNVALTKADVGLGNVWNFDYRSAFNGIGYNTDSTALSFTRVSDATAASIPAMTGATSSAAGKAGLVPKPGTDKRLMFLRGDGTWTEAAASVNNITPSGGNITLPVFSGATSSSAGTQGLVPAPTAGAQDMFLSGNGTWKAAAAAAISAVYPVGSLYWTSKAPGSGGDPNTLFPGTTWKRLKDCVIRAAGDSDPVDDTVRGADSVTLTANNLPQHAHSFTGTRAQTEAESAHTHSVGSHTHTQGGSVSVTTNPTFTGTKESVYPNSTSLTKPDSFNLPAAVWSSLPDLRYIVAVQTLNQSTWTGTLDYYAEAMSFTCTPGISLSRTGSVTQGTWSEKPNRIWTNEIYVPGPAPDPNITTTIHPCTGTPPDTLNITPRGTISGGAYSISGSTGGSTAFNTGTGSAHKHYYTPSGSVGNNTTTNASVSTKNRYLARYCWERTS